MSQFAFLTGLRRSFSGSHRNAKAKDSEDHQVGWSELQEVIQETVPEDHQQRAGNSRNQSLAAKIPGLTPELAKYPKQPAQNPQEKPPPISPVLTKNSMNILWVW